MLNTDLGSVYDANASVLGSIGTGTDEDEENDKIVIAEDDEDFCTYLSGGVVTNKGIRPVFLSPRGKTAAATGQTGLKHHCSAIETLLI